MGDGCKESTQRRRLHKHRRPLRLHCKELATGLSGNRLILKIGANLLTDGKKCCKTAAEGC
jgi:hypothetical protein